MKWSWNVRGHGDRVSTWWWYLFLKKLLHKFKYRHQKNLFFSLNNKQSSSTNSWEQKRWASEQCKTKLCLIFIWCNNNYFYIYCFEYKYEQTLNLFVNNLITFFSLRLCSYNWKESSRDWRHFLTWGHSYPWDWES